MKEEYRSANDIIGRILYNLQNVRYQEYVSELMVALNDNGLRASDLPDIDPADPISMKPSDRSGLRDHLQALPTDFAR